MPVAAGSSPERSQSQTLLSRASVANQWLRALKPNVVTTAWCPCNSKDLAIGNCLRSQRRAVLSELAVTSHRPSGLKPTDPMDAVCPRSQMGFVHGSGEVKFQSRAIVSPPAATIQWPSKLIANAETPPPVSSERMTSHRSYRAAETLVGNWHNRFMMRAGCFNRFDRKQEALHGQILPDTLRLSRETECGSHTKLTLSFPAGRFRLLACLDRSLLFALGLSLVDLGQPPLLRLGPKGLFLLRRLIAGDVLLPPGLEEPQRRAHHPAHHRKQHQARRDDLPLV